MKNKKSNCLVPNIIVIFLIIMCAALGAFVAQAQSSRRHRHSLVFVPGETLVFEQFLGTYPNIECPAGRFRLEWRVETNDSPRQVMEHFEALPDTTPFSESWMYKNNVIYLTNGMPNLFISPPRPPQEGNTTQYVSSNLVSITIWRGRTNLNYLESIPMKNIVRHWTLQKIYDK
jgi:hypothetical protein